MSKKLEINAEDVGLTLQSFLNWLPGEYSLETLLRLKQTQEFRPTAWELTTNLMTSSKHIFDISRFRTKLLVVLG